MESKKFTIKIKGEVFESDDNGMLNLNSIWKGCGLPERKRPSEWKSKVFNELQDSGNIRKLRNTSQGKGQAPYHLWADETGSIAFAMWISTSFYISVVHSFIDLRNGRIEEALNLAASSMSQSDGDKLKDLVWENICGVKTLNQRTALQVAGIKHPIIFMREIRRRTKGYDRLREEGKIVLQTYDQGKWTDRFTQEGFQWLLDKADEMNSWVESTRVANKKLRKSL